MAILLVSGADLSGANLPPTSIVPEEGEFTAFKKISTGVIKIVIPAEAKRSNATGRKCRASYAVVTDMLGCAPDVSMHDGKTKYFLGATVVADKWEENRWLECAGGIHFFITKKEAEEY